MILERTDRILGAAIALMRRERQQIQRYTELPLLPATHRYRYRIADRAHHSSHLEHGSCVAELRILGHMGI